MRALRLCALFLMAAIAHAQTAPKLPEPAPSHPSLVDFGLLYPLSSDWVRATELVRKKAESANSPQNFDVLLAAVYVPNAEIAASNPFFTLLAYRQPATDCKRSLEFMIAHSQDAKDKPDGGVVQFSAAGRDYFRVNMAHGPWGRRQSTICTAANGHLLIWNAGAPNDKGMDEIVNTLNSITLVPPRTAADSAPSAPKDNPPAPALSTPYAERVQKVKVSSGVTTGLLVRKVAPHYPDDARRAYIQGTIILKAEISKTGDIADLELLEGPIELAGSAVAAVRQWKYRPYLLMGQPVTVETQIQVNYELRR
jgi:TonB family protein